MPYSRSRSCYVYLVRSRLRAAKSPSDKDDFFQNRLRKLVGSLGSTSLRRCVTTVFYGVRASTTWFYNLTSFFCKIS